MIRARSRSIVSRVIHSQRYGAVAIALHWLLAAALVSQLVLGWWMLELPKSPPGLRAGWFNVHKSVGLTIGMLVLLRLCWRIGHPVAHAAALPAWQQRTARASHWLLYALMLVLPLSGYLGSVLSGYPVKYFGIVLPSWMAAWPAGKSFMSALHHSAVIAFMATAALHVAAALWHWWRRDEIVARMGLPLRPGTP
jgi:cytochrome b561